MKKIPCSQSLKLKKILSLATGVGLLTASGALCSATGITLGNMASSITGSLTGITKLITGGCYVAGLAFAVTAIMKFKQHKDNPTQIPIGTPVALVFIAAALLFLPSILSVAGYTMFGTEGGKTGGGPTGTIFQAG